MGFVRGIFEPGFSRCRHVDVPPTESLSYVVVDVLVKMEANDHDTGSFGFRQWAGAQVGLGLGDELVVFADLSVNLVAMVIVVG